LCIARAKHLTAAACQQILVFVAAAPIQHLLSLSLKIPMEHFRAKKTRFA
jgi:hypothetical protein